MGVEPLIALPPRVLVAGRLQCGAARAGVRRGHGECAELAHLARGSSKLFTARHAENGPFSREVGENTILATCARQQRGVAGPAQRVHALKRASPGSVVVVGDSCKTNPRQASQYLGKY